MNRGLVAALSVVVVALLAGGIIVAMQQGATSTSSTSSTSTSASESQSLTSTASGGGGNGLELKLMVSASSTDNPSSSVTIQVNAAEYNTLAEANNVTAANDWALNDLSLGSCGRMVYPFGVAVYKGTYTAANVSQGTPLQIYPVVPCPLFIRLVTGYLFQPQSELAAVLPGSSNSTTLMSANVTASGVYNFAAAASPAPLPPGTYSVAAGDEWGTVVVVHFMVGNGTSASTSASSVEALDASRRG